MLQFGMEAYQGRLGRSDAAKSERDRYEARRRPACQTRRLALILGMAGACWSFAAAGSGLPYWWAHCPRPALRRKRMEQVWRSSDWKS
jgi:hypothetical protein